MLINYPIEPKTFEYLTMVDIVAHFLWEITFYGSFKKPLMPNKNGHYFIRKEDGIIIQLIQNYSDQMD